MRFYSFTNMYTSGIHAGIQTAHAVHAMQRKYEKRGAHDEKYLKYVDWADNHQTIIVKNGGYQSRLDSLYESLKPLSARMQLPIIRWRESKEALNGATTAVAIVVPSVPLDPARVSDDESLLGSILSSFNMAS